jgi:DNA-binding NarL/FixJ family response regulator
VSVRVLLADDQRLVRAGFRQILASEGFDVVGEAGDGQEAVELARQHRPDVVLMDVRMPNLDGVEATRRILAEPEPRPRVPVLTTFDLDEYVYEALRAGASGFLLKDAPEDQLAAAIRVVADGGSLFAPSVTTRLIAEFAQRARRKEPPPELDELTPRELEVLRLIARGLSNEEIAAELVVSEHTARTHVSRIFSKLALRDRVQAVVLAYEIGLTQPGGLSAPELR